MDQSRYRHMRILAARIGHFERRPVSLFDPRDHLAPDRAIWIVRINEIEKMGRDGQRKFVTGQNNPSALFGRERNLLFELLQVGDTVFKLPFPVVPELGNNIGPETWGEGKEPLIGGFG